MISALFIITDTGDILISNEYRNEVPMEVARRAFSSLLNEIKSSTQNLLPENEHDGFWSYNIYRNSLYFIIVSRTKLCPIMAVEILSELFSTLTHFCGSISEDSVKSNSILIYEIILEFIEHGYVQLSSPEKLRSLVYSEPVVPRCRPPITEGVQWGLFGLEKPAVHGGASDKPFYTSRIKSESETEEIFVDVIENLSVFVDKEGTVKRSNVYGKMVLKAFIAGSVDMKLRLNKDLNIKSSKTHSGLGSSACLDHCDFHDCVNLELFESSRILQLQPSQGETELMTYQIEESPLSTIPFRLHFEKSATVTSKDLKVSLLLKSNMPMSSKALQVVARLRIPRCTTSLMSQLTDPTQTAELNRKKHEVVWNIKEFSGGMETKANFLLVDGVSNETDDPEFMELGPLALEFELSSFLCSGLQINFLQVDERSMQRQPSKLQRWVRYVTHSNSYVFLLV